MSESQHRASASPRRTFLKAAAGAAAGTLATHYGAAAPGATSPKIHTPFMITPDQAWEWNVFKSKGGPTYAGSVGWKRYTDFLIAKMQEFGAVDLDYVEIPYDHYIVDDWPDRRTHIHNSGIALDAGCNAGSNYGARIANGITGVPGLVNCLQENGYF